MTQPSPNPFSGLKASLARILSGGLMGLVLHLLFWRRIAPMLATLEGLFAQWKAGTLPVPVTPVRAPAAVRTRAAASAGPRQGARRPRVAARRQPVAPVAAPPVAAWPCPDAPLRPMPSLRAVCSRRWHARCTTKLPGEAALQHA